MGVALARDESTDDATERAAAAAARVQIRYQS
jgi:formate-dependent phosphoribosylglycinamide formyltransferase (GAR transformylase)